MAENNNFFQPEFSLAELSEIPGNYRRFVEDPLMLRDVLLEEVSNGTLIGNGDCLRSPPFI